MLINVADYPTVQDALDAARNGDRLYFPGSQVYEAPAGGWIINKRLEIFGDGPGNPDTYEGSVLVPASTGSPALNDVIVLDPPAGEDLNNVFIHDLRITRRPDQTGTDGRSGIRLLSASNKKVSSLRLERVSISLMGGTGLSLLATDGAAGALVGLYMLCCDVQGCGGAGLDLRFGFQTYMARCRLDGNAEEGCRAFESEVAAYATSFEGNNPDTAGLGRTQVNLTNCSVARIDACSFASFGSPNEAACVLQGAGGGQIGGCLFALDQFESTAIGVDAGAVSNGALLVLPNRFAGVGIAVRIANLAASCVVLPQFVESGTTTIALPQGSNDAPIAIPRAHSATTTELSGLLPPAMSTVAASGVQDGMLYFDSGLACNKLRVRAAGQWLSISTVPPRISDLIVIKGRTTLVLRWHAPADTDGGAVASYELKKSNMPITEANFESAETVVTGTPSAPGTYECAGLDDLPSCTLFYFAIKYQLHCGNWSPISSPPTSGSTKCSGSVEVECP